MIRRWVWLCRGDAEFFIFRKWNCDSQHLKLNILASCPALKLSFSFASGFCVCAFRLPYETEALWPWHSQTLPSGLCFNPVAILLPPLPSEVPVTLQLYCPWYTFNLDVSIRGLDGRVGKTVCLSSLGVFYSAHDLPWVHLSDLCCYLQHQFCMSSSKY